MAPSTAYQSCVHTDPSAKSEEFLHEAAQLVDDKKQVALHQTDSLGRFSLPIC
jgi:hypothetical protein